MPCVGLQKRLLECMRKNARTRTVTRNHTGAESLLRSMRIPQKGRRHYPQWEVGAELRHMGVAVAEGRWRGKEWGRRGDTAGCDANNKGGGSCTVGTYLRDIPTKSRFKIKRSNTLPIFFYRIKTNKT